MPCGLCSHTGLTRTSYMAQCSVVAVLNLLKILTAEPQVVALWIMVLILAEAAFLWRPNEARCQDTSLTRLAVEAGCWLGVPQWLSPYFSRWLGFLRERVSQEWLVQESQAEVDPTSEDPECYLQHSVDHASHEDQTRFKDKKSRLHLLLLINK
jgi:hypothetical protein